MPSPKHQGEVPDTCEELAAILERQKARGQDQHIDLPATTFETTMGDQVVEEGKLPKKEESPE